MKRTLSLKRESLTELSAMDLLHVAGAALPTSPVDYCLDKVQNSVAICITDAGQRSRCMCPTEA